MDDRDVVVRQRHTEVIRRLKQEGDRSGEHDLSPSAILGVDAPPPLSKDMSVMLMSEPVMAYLLSRHDNPEAVADVRAVVLLRACPRGVVTHVCVCAWVRALQIVCHASFKWRQLSHLYVRLIVDGIYSSGQLDLLPFFVVRFHGVAELHCAATLATALRASLQVLEKYLGMSDPFKEERARLVLFGKPEAVMLKHVCLLSHALSLAIAVARCRFSSTPSMRMPSPVSRAELVGHDARVCGQVPVVLVRVLAQSAATAAHPSVPRGRHHR
jgi:hypothetical protein